MVVGNIEASQLESRQALDYFRGFNTCHRTYICHPDILCSVCCDLDEGSPCLQLGLNILLRDGILIDAALLLKRGRWRGFVH